MGKMPLFDPPDLSPNERVILERARTQEGPGTHALVVGVSHYPHLSPNEGPVAKTYSTLKQLPSAVLSAKAFANWLCRTPLRNPAAPLGRIELLLSPAEQNEGVQCEAATHANLQAAFGRWFKTCTSSSDNVALLYFCGHGRQPGPSSATRMSRARSTPPR
jgi:hypothetical protein